MSAALQLPAIWATANVIHKLRVVENDEPPSNSLLQSLPAPETIDAVPGEPVLEETVPEETLPEETVPQISLAFYRKHTEKMLRRYLYASMLVGRAPAILGEPVGRGWVSSRKVKTFEDAVIFVLDIERCLNKLGGVDRALLCRIVLQEYTHVETASLLGASVRAVSYKYPMALDRLTELLLASGLLILPPS